MPTPMGRPSEGRTERVQTMVTPEIKAYLEQKRQQLETTVSDIVFHLIEAAQMGIKEIAYTTQLGVKNRCELVSDEIVKEFLDSLLPDIREYYRQSPYENQQLHAGWYLAHRYAVAETKRMGYEEITAYLVDRDNVVIVASEFGDAEGSRIAQAYGFDADEVVRREKIIKWSVIEWRRDGDALVFIGASQGGPQSRFPDPLYHVGVAWAPEALVNKYESTPVLIPSILI